MTRPVFDRLASKFQVDDAGCWVWTASIGAGGYGQISMKIGSRRAPRRAHRVMYEELVGPIPDGLEIDHLCRNRGCVNPDHLEPVTRRVNQLRGLGPQILAAINSSKTHCPQGHPYDADNTGPARNRHGISRRCRACGRAATARHRARFQQERAA